MASRVFTEKPEFWPDKKCPECGDTILRRWYPKQGVRQTLNQYLSRKTCGDKICVGKQNQRNAGMRKVYVHAPDITCLVCGVTVERPEDIPRWIWAKQKTCNSAHCHSQAIWSARRANTLNSEGFTDDDKS